MINVEIDPRILEVCPATQIGLLRAQVVNGDTSDELWQEIENEAKAIAQTYELLAVNQRPAIAATRRLYKALGKDPGRYRVASEALCRRIIRGLGLYRLTTLIDVVNLVSIKSGGLLRHRSRTTQHRGAARVPRRAGRCGDSHQRRGAHEVHPRDHSCANQHQRFCSRDAT